MKKSALTTLVLIWCTYVSQGGYSFVCGDGEIIGLQRERTPGAGLVTQTINHQLFQ